MIHYSMLSFVALLVCATVLGSIATYIVGPWIRKRQAQLRHGCREAVKYPHTDWLFGSDLLRLRKKALRDGRLKMLYLEQHRTLGETWQEIVDGGIRVNTIASANLQYIYALHTSAFLKGNDVSWASLKLFGRGVLTSEGEEWKWNRRLITPTFSKYENDTMPMMKEHVDRFIENLPRDGRTFDAQVSLKRLFLDVASDFLFGEPLNMQVPSKRHEAQAFLDILDSALLGMNKRRQEFNLTSIKLWFDGSYDTDVAKVHTFIDAQVQNALTRVSLDDPRGDDHTKIRGDSVKSGGRYVLADELARQTQDPATLRGSLLQCFLPARDQPAILLSNTLFELARHPEHWTRLRATALSVSTNDELSFQTLSSLYPIRDVISEALRLHGPGGGNRRVAARDIILPQGGGSDGKSPLFVPRGAQVQTHLPVLHRSKTYWGDDADVFRPQRFEENGRSAALGWQFKPFLAGPRTCPAKDQAMIQATYTMMRLLKEFESIECRDEVWEFVEMVRLTTESGRGAKIALKVTGT